VRVDEAREDEALGDLEDVGAGSVQVGPDRSDRAVAHEDVRRAVVPPWAPAAQEHVRRQRALSAFQSRKATRRSSSASRESASAGNVPSSTSVSRIWRR
jgi:hypothetical protein